MSTVPNQKEIILNCMPPFTVNGPSPALSILKAYLCKYGYKVRVIYWNIILHDLANEFTWNKNQKNQQIPTLLYAAYLSVQTKNNSLYNEVKAALQTILPVMLNEKNFYDEHIEKYALKLEQFIDNYLDILDFANILYFGFPMKLNQWVLASVIAEKIKKRNANIPVVIGGINTAEVSKVFLDNFKQFDFAIWGEGETSLLELTRLLENNNVSSYIDIARLYYRENNFVQKSTTTKNLFFNLSENEIYPNYSDYFEIRYSLKIPDLITILIEGGRGCHWNRCHFCYLNNGYKYRQKSVEKLIQEIKYVISNYDIHRFEFLDNDIIGEDLDRFESLLDGFIKIKKDNTNFVVIGAEVITLDLSYSTIKKMYEAGFINIQIGFESASNNLLKKIEKKNTFASNLNTMKHCFDVGIIVLGANVICNFLEETEEDIYESIENLRFFRFIFDEKTTTITQPIHLLVNSSSKYFKVLSERKHEYNPILNTYHKAFINDFDEETKWHFFEFSLNHRNEKWDYFTDLHYHYTNNTCEYRFIHENDKIIYQEFLNKELSEHIEFEKNELYIPILDYCYNKPISINELQNLLSEKDRIFPDLETLVENVDTLFYQGLLYRTPDNTEIVSIVNIKKQEL